MCGGLGDLGSEVLGAEKLWTANTLDPDGDELHAGQINEKVQSFNDGGTVRTRCAAQGSESWTGAATVGSRPLLIDTVICSSH